jgi:hypothetical protein
MAKIKRLKDKQRSTKYYTEYKRWSKTYFTKLGGELRKSKQFLLHMCHPSCQSCYKPGDKTWTRNGLDYNICGHLCLTYALRNWQCGPVLKHYDKWDDFKFPNVNFPFRYSNIQTTLEYWYISLTWSDMPDLVVPVHIGKFKIISFVVVFQNRSTLSISKCISQGMKQT